MDRADVHLQVAGRPERHTIAVAANVIPSEGGLGGDDEAAHSCELAVNVPRVGALDTRDMTNDLTGR